MDASAAPTFPMEEFVVFLAVVYIITDAVVEIATKPTETSFRGVLSGIAVSVTSISILILIADMLIGTRGWMIAMFAGAIFHSRIIRGRMPESSRKEETGPKAS